jgi:hypothetical protein
LAAASSDGSGAGPFIRGLAIATDGAADGVVSVLVDPMFIVDDFATVSVSCSWATISPIAAIATTALLPIVAAHSLRPLPGLLFR